MKGKINKFIAASMLSFASLSAIGCSTSNSKLAKKINNGVDDFVTSINKLDYVDTTKNQDGSVGKIASAISYDTTKFISPKSSAIAVENTITTPAEHSDNFKLFILSESPFVTLTSEDNNPSLTISMRFSTEKIEDTSNDISEKINSLILKRSILMIYINELYNGNVVLTEENKTAINAYVNVIKENASFLNGNRGMVKNQLNMASNLLEKEKNDNLINYYIIKSGEALEIRSNKIDSTISAIDSIINILETNLTSLSKYYQTNLSETYDDLISNLSKKIKFDDNMNIAKEIAESLNLTINKNNKETNSNNQNNVVINNDVNNEEQKNEQTNNNQITNNQLTNNQITNQNTNINNRINSNTNRPDQQYNNNVTNQRANNNQKLATGQQKTQTNNDLSKNQLFYNNNQTNITNKENNQNLNNNQNNLLNNNQNNLLNNNNNFNQNQRNNLYNNNFNRLNNSYNNKTNIKQEQNSFTTLETKNLVEDDKQIKINNTTNNRNMIQNQNQTPSRNDYAKNNVNITRVPYRTNFN